MKLASNLISNRFPYPKLLVILLGVLFFLPFLGHIHLFDWDEINFAESAREMLVSGNYSRVQIDFQPFWEKPPLFFWMQATAMHIFGVNEFAARLPNALIGILTLLTFFLIGRKHYDQKFGIVWALLYFGSFLPHLYFKSGIIDPVFNYFIFLGLYFLIRTIYQEDPKKSKNAIIAGIFTGLAVLTKGPVGLLLVMLTFLVFWVANRFRKVSTLKNILLFALMVFLVSCFWFGMETIKHGPWFLVEFIQYQIRLFSTPDAGHGEPWFYHFVVVFIGCFPMSVFAIRPLFKKAKNEKAAELPLRKWMIYLFWVVMILFTIVKTKIVHYSSMAYFPVSFLAAYQLYHWMENKEKPTRWTLVFNLVFGIIFSLLLIGLPIVMMHKDWLIPYLKDPYAQASLDVHVPMQGWEYLIGVFYLIMVVLTFIEFKNGKLKSGLWHIVLSTGITLMAYTIFVVPKVEAYSQRPAISFYQSIQGKDVYVTTVGFKSYAQFFYFRKPAGQAPKTSEDKWLLTGPIDKPAYFVTKINHQQKVLRYPEVQKIGQKGGFAFFVRYPKDKPKPAE